MFILFWGLNSLGSVFDATQFNICADYEAAAWAL